MAFRTIFVAISLVAMGGGASADVMRDHSMSEEVSIKIGRGNEHLSGHEMPPIINQITYYLDNIGYASSTSIEMRPLHIRSMAQWLAATGNTYNKITGLEIQGHDVEGAIKRGVAGSLEDYALLSETVIVGVLADVENNKGGDFFGSTQVFRVEEVLRGVFPGELLKLRIRSGEDGHNNYIQYSSDINGPIGQRYVLFVSKGLYKLAVAHDAGSTDGFSSHYITQRAPFLVEGDDLHPIGFGVPKPGIKMPEVRAVIKAID